MSKQVWTSIKVLDAQGEWLEVNGEVVVILISITKNVLEK